MVTQSDINRAVFKGLGTRSGVTSAMAPTLGITFEPTLVIAAGRIDKLGVDIRSFREPLERAIKQVIIPSIGMNFDQGGRPEWEGHSAGTEEIRSRLRKPLGAVLVTTGALKRGAMQFNNWKVGRGAAVMSDLPARVWYGKVHQKGYEGKTMAARVKAAGGNAATALTVAIGDALASKSRGHVVPPIPARPFVMLQPEDEDRITEVFIEWLGERVQAAWPGVSL